MRVRHGRSIDAESERFEHSGNDGSDSRQRETRPETARRLDRSRRRFEARIPVSIVSHDLQATFPRKAVSKLTDAIFPREAEQCFVAVSFRSDLSQRASRGRDRCRASCSSPRVPRGAALGVTFTACRDSLRREHASLRFCSVPARFSACFTAANRQALLRKTSQGNR